MFLDDFHTLEDNCVSISAEQGSRFAKTISNDFNPIHDSGNKRFCVPGDLLFALSLSRYGISQSMSFRFSGMVAGDMRLNFPERASSDNVEITDARGKSYLHIERTGQISNNPQLIEALVRNYVLFSGHNFPHILVPLMKEKNVMINPLRPLIIYEGMSFELHAFDFELPTLELERSTLDVDGKRGDAKLYFKLTEAGRELGHGMKTLVLSGFREYEQPVVDQLCEDYLARQSAYTR